MIEIIIKKKAKANNNALNPFFVILAIAILLSKFKSGLTKTQLMICIWAISEPENYEKYQSWYNDGEINQLPIYYNEYMENTLKQCLLNSIVKRIVKKTSIKYTIGEKGGLILEAMEGDELTQRLMSTVSNMQAPDLKRINREIYIKF